MKVEISKSIAALSDADQKKWIADRKKNSPRIAGELDKALVIAKEKLKKDESKGTVKKSE